MTAQTLLDTFSSIRPFLANNPKAGCEPTLIEMMRHYYISHLSLNKEEIDGLCDEYIKQWVVSFQTLENFVANDKTEVQKENRDG